MLSFVNIGEESDAHFWLDGPKDFYLGFTKLGGGALLEHSH